MLKAIVQQVHRVSLRGGEVFFNLKSRRMAVLPDDHWTAKLSRNQQRFIAELLGSSVGLYYQHSVSEPPITARQNVNPNASLREQPPEHDYKWSLARATD